MITFEPLWETLKTKGISQYKLIKDYKISTGQLDRLRKNGNVNTYTLNLLCEILDCDLSDIAKYTNKQQKQQENLIPLLLLLYKVVLTFYTFDVLTLEDVYFILSLV